jgi:hypothetical protein
VAVGVGNIEQRAAYIGGRQRTPVMVKIPSLPWASPEKLW